MQVVVWIILCVILFAVSTIREVSYAKYEALLNTIESILYPINLNMTGNPHGLSLGVFIYPLLEWAIGGAILGYFYGKLKNR